ncbi:MAG: hypothetical protein QXR89_06850 [Candidatus Bathyarchaeia archaeon]
MDGQKGGASTCFPIELGSRFYMKVNPPRISFSTEKEGNKAKWIKPNLIDNIVFIADKGRTWNQYLQVSIINITEEDFNTICNAIVEGTESQ